MMVMKEKILNRSIDNLFWVFIKDAFIDILMDEIINYDIHIEIWKIIMIR